MEAEPLIQLPGIDPLIQAAFWVLLASLVVAAVAGFIAVWTSLSSAAVIRRDQQLARHLGLRFAAKVKIAAYLRPGKILSSHLVARWPLDLLLESS